MWIKIKGDRLNLDNVGLIQFRGYKINIVQGNRIYEIIEGPNLTNEEFNHIKEKLLKVLEDKTIVLLEEEKK